MGAVAEKDMINIVDAVDTVPIRYYDIVALSGVMSSLKLDCLHIASIISAKFSSAKNNQAF